MASAISQPKLSGIARTLIQEKLLTEDEAHAIEEQAHSSRVPFISQVIQNKKSARYLLPNLPQEPLVCLISILMHSMWIIYPLKKLMQNSCNQTECWPCSVAATCFL